MIPDKELISELELEIARSVFMSDSYSNKFKTVTALFVGMDKSLRYRKNMTYTLLTRNRSDGSVFIQREDKSGACLYGSVASFEKNWHIMTL